MGGGISKIMDRIFGSKEMRLLMLGLDAAGKTSELLSNSTTTTHHYIYRSLATRITHGKHTR